MKTISAAIFEAPSVDWWGLLPQMVLLGVALSLLLITSISRSKFSTAFSTLCSVLAGSTVFLIALGLWGDVQELGPRSSLASAFAVDGFSIFFTILISLGVVTTALLSHSYIEREGIDSAEYHALLMCSAAGAIVMASANDLIVLFIGLEALSIGLYVMIAIHTRRAEAREAAMKYFVLGAFSSAFFLYGIALVYGATGSTNLVQIRDYLDEVAFKDEHILLAGIGLLLIGLAFKVAAAPFHFWAPDVYQGAPSPVTGYMASIAKAAGFAALLRVFFAALPSYKLDWSPIISALAILTLVAGAVMAILQTDVKRMLAFSSVSHAGYVLVAIQSANASGTSAALFYLFTYSFVVIGSFGVVSLMGWKDGHSLDRYSGIGRSRPVLALAFTVFLLAQAGVPLTSGFVGKFQVITSAVDVENYILASIAMLTAVVSAYMYLKIVMTMYVTENNSEGPYIAIHWTSGVVLGGILVFTLAVGIIPQSLIDFSQDAVPVLIAG
jgi:NADH-quinone oxidoreductase subunit N